MLFIRSLDVVHSELRCWSLGAQMLFIRSSDIVHFGAQMLFTISRRRTRPHGHVDLGGDDLISRYVHADPNKVVPIYVHLLTEKAAEMSMT